MFQAKIQLCSSREFDFEKFYCFMNSFKTRANIKLDRLSGEGNELLYKFITDSEQINIRFDASYQYLNLFLMVKGSLESFNKYYKEIEDIKKSIFYRKKESNV